MGYYYSADPENAVPVKSWATPKTHTPGSPVKERGYRFYMPECGRWVNRDPIGEVGFELASKRPKSQEEIEREIETELFELLSRVDPLLASQLRLHPVFSHHIIYPFMQNNPLHGVDPLGLSCFTDCWRKCIKDNYGKSFDTALGLSYLSVVAIIQDVYNGAVEALAKEKLDDVKLAGAFTDGDITKKMDAAEKAAKGAKSLSMWTKVLSFLSKASGVVSAGATGYVVGASGYCSAECL